MLFSEAQSNIYNPLYFLWNGSIEVNISYKNLQKLISLPLLCSVQNQHTFPSRQGPSIAHHHQIRLARAEGCLGELQVHPV